MSNKKPDNFLLGKNKNRLKVHGAVSNEDVSQSGRLREFANFYQVLL